MNRADKYACKKCGKLIKESGYCIPCANNRTRRNTLIQIALLTIALYSLGFLCSFGKGEALINYLFGLGVIILVIIMFYSDEMVKRSWWQ